MPKYLVTSGSHFTPFTYDELVKPVAHMQAAHDAAQDAYDTLNLETSALRNYISDNPDDSRAKAMYDNYMDKLTTLQNNLWEHGYNGQTRRDLSAARSAYASDITRLGKAIQTRQERSKAYWDMRHKNPDLIMGEDPGVAGLNYYLDDDNYGQDYFSYSGQQFMSEVGADAKARAGEMLRDPQVLKNPDLVGYLTTIQQDGFTNQEVQNAGNAVRAAVAGNSAALDSLDPASRILADVLMSHLNSTGAQGRVSADEYNRLLGYGISGLSQGIGKTDVRQVNDKMWDYSRQVALANMRAASSGSSRTTRKKDDGYARPYTLNDIASYMKTKDADKITNTLENNFVDPFKEPIRITGSDGRPDIITNPADAARILADFGQSDFERKYGISPEVLMGSGRHKFTYTDESGRKVEAEASSYNNTSYTKGQSTNNMVHFEVMRNGKMQNDPELSNAITNDLNEYNRRLNAWKEKNPNVDLRKLAITGKKRQKIYKDYGIPEDMPIGDAYSVMMTKTKEGYTTPATLADPTMAKTLAKYEGFIFESFGRASRGKSQVNKTSDAAFYDVDGYEISGKADKGRKIDNIIPKRGMLNSITMYPEDVLQNKVRIATTDGKTYAINPVMLGNNVDVTIQRLRPQVMEMMLPIEDPVAALRLSTDDAAQWIYDVSQMLGDYMAFDRYDTQGNFSGFITPDMIVRNPALQSELRTAITRYMNNVLAMPRETMDLNNYRVRGDTSDKATGYNDYLYYEDDEE